MNNFLQELRTSPQFHDLIKKIKSHRPVIPKYDPKNGNVEEWKYASAKQEGVDIALRILGEQEI